MILFNWGGVIKGDANFADHAEWIQCDSLSFGTGRSVVMAKGVSDRKGGDPSFSEIQLTKGTDKASVDLFMASIGALEKKQETAEIHFCDVDGEKIDVYMKFKLANCMITGYSASSGGDKPQESISLNYNEIKVYYKRKKPDGTDEEVGPKGWNITDATTTSGD